MIGVALLAGSGCGGDKPATCAAPDSGARAGFHAPAPGETWLPDCNNPLRREYWRVFAVSADSAYTFPRLDGEAGLAGDCFSPGASDIGPLVLKYRLCGSAVTAEDVALVNNMVPAEALAITHHLHAMFQFGFGGNETVGVRDIFPSPAPTDVIDACGLHPATNSPELTALCGRVADALQAGTTAAIIYEGLVVVELVSLLDELYGVTPR
jgi:hypothetical protein